MQELLARQALVSSTNITRVQITQVMIILFPSNVEFNFYVNHYYTRAESFESDREESFIEVLERL